MGDLLVEAGVATRAGVEAGLTEQRLRGGRLGFNLMKGGQVTPAALYLFLKDHPFFLAPDLEESLRDAPAVDLVPARLAHHYGMVPVRAADGVLDLALSSVDTPGLLPALEELTGLRVDPLVCPPAWIRGTLARFYPAEVEPGVEYRPCGDNLFVLSEHERGIRPRRPEMVPEDAVSAEWLRAIAAAGIHRRSRRIQIEPQRDAMQVTFRGAPGGDSALSLPRGAYSGVASLIEGLSRIAARGRILPRDGRFAVSVDRRRLIVSVLALPGFEGHAFTLDLREERVAEPARETLERDLPAMVQALRGLETRGHGLILLAGPGPSEAAVGVTSLLTLLGDRLPRRVALGDGIVPHGVARIAALEDEEEIPLEPLLGRALSENPDLLLLPDRGRAQDPGVALALARDRVVVMPVEATDAYDAAERLARRGAGSMRTDDVIGILGVRLMETLCRSCRVPYDLLELLSPGPEHRRVAAGAFFSAPGCPACRGAGVVDLEPVFEFLPADTEESPFRPGLTAADLRERCARRGTPNLFQSAIGRASTGAVDVREPLRLLLHEQY